MLVSAVVRYVVSTILATTLIPAVASAVVPPYVETFDAEATCSVTCGVACPLASGWVNDAGDDMDWVVHTDSTGSSPTGPTGDHTSGAGNYLYTETTGAACTSATANLVSPDLDLTGSNATQLEFWYHMYGDTMGTLHVDIDPDGGGDGPWTLDVVPSITDDVDLWQTMTVDLSAYVGTTINVRLRSESGTSFTSDMAIDDIRVFDTWADDVGVASIDDPIGGCGLSANQPIAITIANHGTNAQSNFDVSYTVDGGIPVVETFTGTVAAGATTSFTFATTADLSGAGPFTLDASTSLATDQAPANDGATVMITSLGSDISTFPHVNDFESGPGDWFTYGTNNTWAFGTPAKATIVGAASGVNAWVTGGLTGTYSNSELSYVETQCGYDFSSLTYPAVRLRIWRATETNFDQAILQASTDGGSNWQTIGTPADPNWYNDSVSGWTGQSGGYVTVFHELDAYAGMPSVKFRMEFGTDSTVTQDGFAFDDFEIFDNPPQINVTDASPPGALASVAPGLSNVLVQTLRLDAIGNIGSSVDAITVTRQGSVLDSDIAGVKLWLDNGDGVFRAVDDTTFAMGTFSGGVVSFAGLTAFLDLVPLVPRWVHITFDLAPMATPGASFGSSIDSAADITPAMAVPVVLLPEPMLGPISNVLERVDSLPFTDDFDDPTIANRTTQTQDGLFYPVATSVGPFVDPSPSPSPNTGQVQLIDRVDDGAGGLITAMSAPLMAALSSPNGGAASALEYWFDLSTLNVNDDLLWLMFSWNNANMNDHNLNNVFISTDATSTWAASVYHFDFAAPVPPGWHDEVVDVSTPLLFSGSDYSATTVLRFQAFGLNDFGQDGLTIDNIWLGIPQYAYVERDPGTGLPSGTIDGVYGMGTGPITLSYTLANPAHLPLDTGDITISDTSGLTGISVTPSTLPTPMNPGDSTSFEVSFDATDENFSFLLTFPTNDPRAMGGVYALTVIGEHAPDIAIERPIGVQIANGGTDALGQHLPGQSANLTYTIINDGTLELLLSDDPDFVTIANDDNVTAVVTVQPEIHTVPPGGSATFEVAYSVIAAADFQFDLIIGNNVSGQDPYTVTVTGTAAMGMPDAGMGNVDAGMGDPDAGPVGPDAGPTDPPGDDGCKCDVGDRPARGPSPVWLIFLVAIAMLYRRRGRSSHPRSQENAR